jgi:hypothetical protein
MPASGSNRELAEAGLLMSYGTNLVDMFHQVGIYAASILKGAEPTLPLLFVEPADLERLEKGTVLQLHGLHAWLHGAQQDCEIAYRTDGRGEGRIKVRRTTNRLGAPAVMSSRRTTPASVGFMQRACGSHDARGMSTAL